MYGLSLRNVHRRAFLRSVRSQRVHRSSTSTDAEKVSVKSCRYCTIKKVELTSELEHTAHELDCCPTQDFSFFVRPCVYRHTGQLLLLHPFRHMQWKVCEHCTVTSPVTFASIRLVNRIISILLSIPISPRHTYSKHTGHVGNSSFPFSLSLSSTYSGPCMGKANV